MTYREKTVKALIGAIEDFFKNDKIFEEFLTENEMEFLEENKDFDLQYNLMDKEIEGLKKDFIKILKEKFNS